MKINALALKNLNSLRGEFRLDFDASPLADAGIFAITGPTGAGKTTILDAICVALYGQTPRLSPGSSFELLTRNTGECFAEVEFTVESGRYRSRWSRRRARNRADGNIQPTSMELVAITPEGDEQIIEDQVRQVVERVESLTGLDFARFTRSVMLAQGSFAAFLKAKDNERAELLERMTGTRLYSFISIQAFTRAREERQRLDEMIAVNAHLAVMPAEQKAELLERKRFLESEIVTAEAAITTLRNQAATAARHKELVGIIAEAEQALAVVMAEEGEAASSLARLAEAELALPLFADVKALDALEERLTRLRAESTELSGQCEVLKKSEDDARQTRLALDQEAEQFAQKATARDEAMRTAEMLDEQIRVQGLALAIKQHAVSTCDSEILAIQAEHHKQNELLVESLSRLQSIDTFLTENAADARLSQDGGIIAGALRELAVGRQRYAANRQDQKQIIAGIERQKKEAAALNERKTVLTAAILSLHNRIDECEDHLAKTLQGRSWEDVEAGLVAKRQRLSVIEAVLAVDADCKRVIAERAAKDERRKTIVQGLEADKVRRQQMAVDKDQAEQMLSLLEETQRLAAKVAKYEAERTRLADGKPCPLCGALSHPWQDGAPVMDEGSKAVAAQRKKVTSLISELATLDGRMHELFETANVLGLEVTTLANSVEQLTAKLDRTMKEADLSDPTLASSAKTDLLKAIADDQQRLVVARKFQAERETFMLQLHADEKGESSVVVELEKLLALVNDQQATLVRLKEEGLKLLESGKTLGVELEERLLGYGIALPAPGQEEITAELLSQRWQRFDQARQDRVGIETLSSDAKRNLAVLMTQESNLRARRTQEEAAVKEGDAAIASLTAKRVAVLGNESVATARQQMSEARALFAARMKESDRTITDLATRAAATQGAFKENSQQMERMTDDCKHLSQEIEKKLLSAGFVDLPGLRSALIPDSELQELRGVREGLNARRQRLDDRLQETRAQRELFGAEAEEFDLEALQTAIAQGGEALAVQQRELGALTETLRRQEELVAEQLQRAALIDNQRREQRHWQLLSDMIGSADGKKFRRFAQGLTLDHLIYLANRQLIRLSDRYLLRRHPDEELGLEIIDTYQADAIRPTGTLSGGEEFLVSLALALGLANLSGQTRIDSLFLDEGFGTLDTDTLETALSALAALHETGKTIGVISHVDALKERIPVQIRLRKLAGGCSDLSVAA